MVWPLRFVLFFSLSNNNKSGLPFGLFWNSFIEMKWISHLALSWPFFKLEENSILLGLFWLNFNKTYIISWYSKFVWNILENFLWKFSHKYLAFFHIWEFGLLKLLMTKYGLFLGGGDLATLQQMTSSNAFFVLSFLIETAMRIYLRPRHALLHLFGKKLSDTKKLSTLFCKPGWKYLVERHFVNKFEKN